MSLKYDWYQSDQKVVITVLVKNVADKPHSVNIFAKSVLLEAENTVLNLDLSKAIDPENSKYIINQFKIEILLAKIDSSRWDSLEAKKKIATEENKMKPDEWEKFVKENDKKEEKEREVIKSI